MMTASAFYGVRSVAGFVKGLLSANEAKSISLFKKAVQEASSTKRILNNPPKKNYNNNNNDDTSEKNDEGYRTNILVKKKIRLNYTSNQNNNNGFPEIEINNNNYNYNNLENTGIN